MRLAGALLVTAGLTGAAAPALVGFPGAFMPLLVAALLLWLTGIGTAAASLSPPRPLAGVAALSAGLLGWPLLLASGLAPLWGALAAICGMVVAVRGSGDRGRCTSEGPGERPTTRAAC